MTARPNYSKQFFSIQKLLRSLLLPEQIQQALFLVFLLLTLKKVLSDLGTLPFSISVDASNHKEVKLFPLVIRFFSAKVRVKVRLLDLRSLPRETAEQIMNFFLLSTKKKLDLQQLTSFCADNAPVNFGGSNQAEKKQCVLSPYRTKKPV